MNNDRRMAVYDAKIVRGDIEQRWRELYAEWKKAASKCSELYREYVRGLGKAQTYDEWHEMAYKDHDAQMEKEVLSYRIEDIRVEWRKADDEVKRLEALNERKHEPEFAARDFMYSLSMKQWPQHGYKLIHENGGEYWTQDYRCAKPDKIPANRRSRDLLKEQNEASPRH